MASRRIPEETINQIRDLYSKGVPVREITAATGVSVWPVWRYTRDLVENPFRSGKKILPETIRKIRELYMTDMQLWEICKKLGVSNWQIQYYTTGLPRRNRVITPQQKEAIREMYRESYNPHEIAHELKVGINTVYATTIDLRTPARRDMGERVFEILDSLTRIGYFIVPPGTKAYMGCIRRLSKRLEIRRVRIRKRARKSVVVICFLPDKKEAAAKAVVGLLRERSMSYHKLALITRVFGVKLPEKEKRELVA